MADFFCRILLQRIHDSVTSLHAGVNYMQLQIIFVQRIACSVDLLPIISLFDLRFHCLHVLTSSPSPPGSDKPFFFFRLLQKVLTRGDFCTVLDTVFDCDS